MHLRQDAPISTDNAIGSRPMRLEARTAAFVFVVAATTWPAAAAASGHELNALDGLLTTIAVCFAAVPWLASGGLLFRRPARLTWFLGTGLGVAAILVILATELPGFCIALAALPAVLHQVKLVRAGGVGPEGRNGAPAATGPQPPDAP
jgi:hypothetical protein